MTDLRIDRLELRGRLPGADGDAHERAQRVVAAACGELLERAFERAGVSDDGELCIRALDVEARLPWERGDVAMATTWSLRVAEAARAAVEAGGPGVVRYESVAQALCDVLGSAARGDFSRAWAWSQLGLWTGGAELRGVADALAARPELCAAVLRETAARGLLAPLLRALPGQTWARVARAVLTAAGASPALADAAADGLGDDGAVSRTAHSSFGDSQPAAGAAPEAALRARVRRSASASPLCLALSRAASLGLSPASRRALCVLALADADPAALRSPRAPHFVALLDDELRARSGAPRPQARRDGAAGVQSADADAGRVRDTTGAPGDGERGVGARAEADTDAPTRRRDTPASPNAGDAARGGDAISGTDVARDDRDTHASRAGAGVEAAHAGIGGDSGDDSRSAREDASDVHAHAAHDPGDETATLDDALADTGGDSEPPIARQRGHTRFGGLLFLLHLVDALGLPAEWSEAGPLAARPLRVALHALALALLREAGHDDVAPDDPAVLAFAGLRPLDPPPLATNGATEPRRSRRNETEGGGAGVLRRETDAPEGLTHDEQAAIDDAALRIGEALAERLPAEFGAVPPLPRYGGEGRGEGEGDAPTSVTREPSPAGAGEGSAALRDLRGFRSFAGLLARLIERRAEIVADPGWIELRLALDQIDTRVRRAGLDLDPGYVPWLGVVVKFRYV